MSNLNPFRRKSASPKAPDAKNAAPVSKPAVVNGTIYIGNGSYFPKDIFSWPFVSNYPVSSYFGYRKDPFTGETKYHSGVDISVPGGTPILAAADGTVIIANSTDSWGGGYGYYVKIQHDGGYTTLYAHCSQIAVSGNQEVMKGQIIAYVGSTGRSTGNHLHWEVYKDGVRTNPRTSLYCNADSLDMSVKRLSLS